MKKQKNLLETRAVVILTCNQCAHYEAPDFKHQCTVVGKRIPVTIRADEEGVEVCQIPSFCPLWQDKLVLGDLPRESQESAVKEGLAWIGDPDDLWSWAKKLVLWATAKKMGLWKDQLYVGYLEEEEDPTHIGDR